MPENKSQINFNACMCIGWGGGGGKEFEYCSPISLADKNLQNCAQKQQATATKSLNVNK